GAGEPPPAVPPPPWSALSPRGRAVECNFPRRGRRESIPRPSNHATFVVGGAAGGGEGLPRKKMPTTIPTTNPMSEPINCVSTSLPIAHWTASVQLKAEAAPAATGGVYQ